MSARPRRRRPTTTGRWLSVCSKPASATATGSAKNNNLLAIDGDELRGRVVNGNFNIVAASGKDSEARVDNGSGNIVFAGSDSTSRVNGQGSLNSVTALCGGTSTTAQSAQIKASAPCVGVN